MYISTEQDKEAYYELYNVQ